jgi:hypothetical protein
MLQWKTNYEKSNTSFCSSTRKYVAQSLAMFSFLPICNSNMQFRNRFGHSDKPVYGVHFESLCLNCVVSTWCSKKLCK